MVALMRTKTLRPSGDSLRLLSNNKIYVFKRKYANAVWWGREVKKREERGRMFSINPNFLRILGVACSCSGQLLLKQRGMQI